MSNEVKRYNPVTYIAECEQGDFVKLADYNRAIAERDAAIAQRNRVLDGLSEVTDERDKIISERDAAVAELAETKQALWSAQADRDALQDRLLAGCHPACPGCGLKSNNEQGKAVLWCDECYVELRAEVDRLKKDNSWLASEMNTTKRRDTPAGQLICQLNADLTRLKAQYASALALLRRWWASPVGYQDPTEDTGKFLTAHDAERQEGK
jgi:hypothetical protein